MENNPYTQPVMRRGHGFAITSFVLSIHGIIIIALGLAIALTRANRSFNRNALLVFATGVIISVVSLVLGIAGKKKHQGVLARLGLVFSIAALAGAVLFVLLITVLPSPEN